MLKVLYGLINFKSKFIEMCQNPKYFYTLNKSC